MAFLLRVEWKRPAGAGPGLFTSLLPSLPGAARPGCRPADGVALHVPDDRLGGRDGALHPDNLACRSVPPSGWARPTAGLSGPKSQRCSELPDIEAIGPRLVARSTPRP